ncbi:MAG: MFS transporter [Candidatus Wallbacteria bacterium]|nr:MFS transporter [Candidatus Wallbacteria bacterium]
MAEERKEPFSALNPSILGMVLMVVLVGMGERMAERFLPLYLMALGGSSYSIGFLNAMTNLLNALYSFPGGWLSDKLGYKRALTVFTLLSMCGYLIVIFVPCWQAVLVGALFFISWSAISLPAVMSLVSKAVPKNKRTLGVTIHSLVRRFPMAFGPVCGGLMIKYYGTVQGVRFAFAAAFILAGISLFVQDRFIKEKKPDDTSLHLRDSIKFIRGDLANLLISDILIRFAEQIPYAFVVIWCVKNMGVTEPQFGYLTAIEMATAVLIYLPVAYFADRFGKKPFVVITFGFFTIFPLAIYYSHSFELMILAFVIRGLKEFGEPTRKALIMDLAPDHAKAATFGTYYLIRDVIVSIAALASAPLWNISPEANFFTAFGCGLIGMIYFAIFGKDVSVEKK